MLGKHISDVLYGSALLVNASLFIPQAVKIFKQKCADEISLITFAGFNLIQIFGFINGLYHEDYALIIGQSVSFFACFLVTIQVVLYKLKRPFLIKNKGIRKHEHLS